VDDLVDLPEVYVFKRSAFMKYEEMLAQRKLKNKK